MADDDKIAAVVKYLSEELGPDAIENNYDSGRKAQVFKLSSGGRNSSAVVTDEFFEKNAAAAIPGRLKAFLLAEHLKDCNFPLVVTANGLSD